MILTDKEILSSKPLIKPFKIEQLTPNGYDVSSNKYILIPSHGNRVIVSNETIKLPNNMSAQVWIKQKFARQGIILSGSMIDAGFNGTLALSLFNSGVGTVVIKKDETVAQVVFIKLDREVEKAYKDRSGHYQNQKEDLIK